MTTKKQGWNDMNASQYKGRDLWQRFINETKDRYPREMTKGGAVREKKYDKTGQRKKQRRP